MRKGSIVIGIILIAIAACLALPHIFDYLKSDIEHEHVREEAVVEPEETEDDSWKYVDIDFESLQEMNPDIIAWIRFDDTEACPIDYPILHGDTNDEYLHTTPEGRHSYCGSIFMESENKPDFSDIYNIIYGHNMKNGSMFGYLQHFKEKDYWDANQYFTIYTPKGAYRYQIFSTSMVDKYDRHVYSVGYEPGEEYKEAIDFFIDNADYDTGIKPNENNKIITLSTCSSYQHLTYRYIVQGAMVDLYEK